MKCRGKKYFNTVNSYLFLNSRVTGNSDINNDADWFRGVVNKTDYFINRVSN